MDLLPLKIIAEQRSNDAPQQINSRRVALGKCLADSNLELDEGIKGIIVILKQLRRLMKHTFCLPLAFFLFLAPLFAQGDTEVARNTRDTFAALNRLESFTPEDQFATGSPADPDLGEQLILTRRERYRPFNVGAGYATTWTSNAFYTPDSPSSDVFMSAFANALALPHLGNNYFFEGAASFTGYRYFKNSVLDFNSLETSAGFVKVFRELSDLGLYARYEYTSLFARTGGDLLQEHSLVTGLRKTLQFSRANALFLSAEADFVVGGAPSYALAHDFTLFAAHQINWTRVIQSSLFYQMDTLAFVEGGRTDFRNAVGTSLGFRPLKWVNIFASTWLGWNSSNQNEFNYFVANIGGGITASINF